jgi:hypothetical protein
MREFISIFASLFAAAAWLPAFADDDNEAGAAEAESDAGYVVREEKVVNFETGKTETETVIEFPEVEIFPELARPVGIIIPRTKPDFDKMPFTIYNNEPSYYLPEEYRLQYYRRVPVGGDSLGDVKTGDMFKPAEPDEGREVKAESDGG